MRILIVDKDRNVCALVQKALENYCDERKEDWEICCQTEVEDDDNTHYDLIFCGFEHSEKELDHRIWRQRRAAETDMIYVVPERYPVMQLMRFHPFSCIAKPVDYEMVYETIRDYYEVWRVERHMISLKRRNHLDRYRISEIYYIESDRRQIKVVAENREESYYGSIKSLEQELGLGHFLRCHSSFLANYDNVVEVRSDSLVFPGNRVIPISQGKHKEVMEKIRKWEERNN